MCTHQIFMFEDTASCGCYVEFTIIDQVILLPDGMIASRSFSVIMYQ